MAIWRNAGEPAPLPFLGENTEPLKLQISMLTVPISILFKEYSFKRLLGERRKDKSGGLVPSLHISFFPFSPFISPSVGFNFLLLSKWK